MSLHTEEASKVCGIRVGYALGMIVLLALGLRIGAVLAMGGPPEKDALQYHSIAANLVAGHGYAITPDVPTSLRPPVYPLFLTAIYAMVGTDYHVVLYVQALLHALLVLPLFLLARRLSGSHRVGLLTAGLFAVHPSFEVVSRMYAENLLVPLLLAFLFLMHRALSGESGHTAYAVVAGIVAGLLGLTKPEYGLLGLGAWMLALVWPAARRRWKAWATVLLVSLLVFSAWQIRDLALGSSEEKHLGSETFLFANCPAIDGEGWWSLTDMSRMERQRAVCHTYLDAHAGELKGISLLQLWRQHPWPMAKLVLNRMLILWFSPPVGSSHLAAVSPVLSRLAFAGNAVFVLFALAGLLHLLSTRPELFSWLAVVVYMTVVYGLLHAIRRYGYPFVPELCLLAAWGAIMLYGSRNRQREEPDAHQ